MMRFVYVVVDVDDANDVAVVFAITAAAVDIAIADIDYVVNVVVAIEYVVPISIAFDDVAAALLYIE